MSDSPLRAAIYVDFDNVVSGLRDGAGPEWALRFAEAPEEWLGWLSRGAARRMLIRRCYMNPAGWLEGEQGERRYFSGFRAAFQAAGFEVVDFPRLSRAKNAADLRIALDILDALANPHARIAEFTLLSSDSDFVPLLLRLRAADRATRLVAHPDLGRVVRAAADEVIGLDALAAALGWRAAAEAHFGPVKPEEILAALREAMAEARGPVHLPTLGKMGLERTGQTLRGSDYAGFGALEPMLEAAGGFIRQDGPGGGYVLRPEWLIPSSPEGEAAAAGAQTPSSSA
ncbi:MAG: NYN domain-containing protein [Roseococcus sp.]|nr:NYN domain-containing protein [Roseococcus sp.]